MKRSRLYYMVIALFMVVGGWQLGQGVYIYIKAEVAQTLMLSAWEKSQRTGQHVKPWPWADTWPVARLIVPAHHVDLIVLAGDTGRTLAFGPGVNLATPNPGVVGNSIISAHRDTHFNFLQDLHIGDELLIETQQQTATRFVVTNTHVVDSRTARIGIDFEKPMLTLVTCFPFNSPTAGGPLRYVVFAEPVELQSNGTLV